jgi:hypothetical protein
VTAAWAPVAGYKWPGPLWGWRSIAGTQQSLYIEAIGFLIESELGTSDFNVAVFSDDLEFVEAHVSD